MTGNRYHHLGWHHGIDLFEADFSTQTFTRHAHAGFAIGAIAAGAGGYRCRGEVMVLPPGSLSLMNPEEPHTGYAASAHVRYTMLYASEEAVRAVLGLTGIGGFSEVAPTDRGLALSRALAQLAHRLAAPAVPEARLAIEEAVHAVLTQAFGHYGGAALVRPRREPKAIARVRERIRAGVAGGEPLSLSDLAREADLAPSYLIRSMTRATGLSPHGHVLRARVEAARQHLLAGLPAAEAALAAGFCDQSHLIRQFRRHYGVTPGALIRH